MKTKKIGGGVVAAAAVTTCTAAASTRQQQPVTSIASSLPPVDCDNISIDCNLQTQSSLSSQPQRDVALNIPRGGHTPPGNTTTEHNIDKEYNAAKERLDRQRRKKKKKKSKSTKRPSNKKTQTQKKDEQEGSSSSSSNANNDSKAADNNNSGSKKTQEGGNDKNSNSQTTTAASSNKNDSESIDSERSSNSNSNNNNNSNNPSLPPEAQSILQQTCHYDILGITDNKSGATQIEIQKAYRRRCVLTHPDKTKGDRSAFDKVYAAYDVLSCEKKRSLYDKFGHEGVESGNNGSGGNGMRGFGRNFGNDIFREFFGTASAGNTGDHPFFQFGSGSGGFGRRSQQSRAAPPRGAPRTNRDLRYQLEVTLEELYTGTTKHVAIQQPTPLQQRSQPQHSYNNPAAAHRKEVEVTLSPGMQSGQSIRLSGVVDSIPDAAPADVIFILRQRPHSMYTRKGYDLAMTVRISYAESIVGYKRRITCLNGREIVICNPVVKKVVVVKEEMVDVPALPQVVVLDEGVHTTQRLAVEDDEDENQIDVVVENDVATSLADNSSTANCSTTAQANATNVTTANVTATSDMNGGRRTQPQVVEQITKTTTISYKLPPAIIQTGNVHVLKGYGMPIKKNGGGLQYHDDENQYGDLYIQYVVDTPGGSSASSNTAGSAGSSDSSSTVNVDNLSPQERIELARLLSKLEGRTDDPTVGVVHTSNDNDNDNKEYKTEDGMTKVHHLVVGSAYDFGRTTRLHNDDDHDDEHLLHDDDEDHSTTMPHGFRSTDDVNEFVHRAFTSGRGSRTGGAFGMGAAPFGFGFSYGANTGASSRGGYYGYDNVEEEDDHTVQCNQM